MVPLMGRPPRKTQCDLLANVKEHGNNSFRRLKTRGHWRVDRVCCYTGKRFVGQHCAVGHKQRPTTNQRTEGGRGKGWSNLNAQTEIRAAGRLNGTQGRLTKRTPLEHPSPAQARSQSHAQTKQHAKPFVLRSPHRPATMVRRSVFSHPRSSEFSF